MGCLSSTGQGITWHCPHLGSSVTSVTGPNAQRGVLGVSAPPSLRGCCAKRSPKALPMGAATAGTGAAALEMEEAAVATLPGIIRK